MKIKKFIHSCILLEEKSQKILFDPGVFSFLEGTVKPEEFSDIDAVVITHEHADHLDIPALKKIVKKNKCRVVSNASVRDILTNQQIPVEVVENGKLDLGNFFLEGISATHEPLLQGVPKNIAYLVNGIFLHPGDSYDPVLHDLDSVSAIALPILGPWGRAVDAADFVAAIRPQIVIPTHDGFAKDFFLKLQYKGWRDYLENEGISFHPLGLHDEVEI